MKVSKDFNPWEAEIEGTNLIEASAGTGKTHAITTLFLRLIVEKGFSVEEVLVVTFTQAATEELKDRIRRRIREAIELFSSTESKDPLLSPLKLKARNPTEARFRLREALRSFDQAAIFTIHAFLKRVLSHYAFESGSPFDTELVSDQEDIKREVVYDFWRKHFYSASPLFVSYALRNGFHIRNLLSLISFKVRHPFAAVIPPRSEIPQTQPKEQEFRASFRTLAASWPEARNEVADILLNHPGLGKTKYGKNSVQKLLWAMDQYTLGSAGASLPFKGLENFSSRVIKKWTKKNYTPPAHPLFDLCEHLVEKSTEIESLFREKLVGLKGEFLGYAETELKKRKEARNVQFFDDLVVKAYQALRGRRGEALSRVVRNRYRAALIDEFQDTDPAQYAIFNELFGKEKGPLFLIGDPKQSIYGFRGADIFAYIKAKQETSTQYSLSENHRSHPDLISAVNSIFSRSNRPFIHESIPFQPSKPGELTAKETLLEDGRPFPALELWFADADSITRPGQMIDKHHAYELIPRAVASEISRLLALSEDQRVVLGSRRLSPADIAVLVHTNAQAQWIKEALSSLHIPAVISTNVDLFDSHEAMEMERVLHAANSPNDHRALVAALATDMMGHTGEDIYSLISDQARWEKSMGRFRRYHDVGNRRGVIRMLREIIFGERVLPRLMRFPDGERRCTNVLHLCEVLHQRSTKKPAGLSEVLKWLCDQRHPNSERAEEYQLRLESDESAVKVMTIHKSKGLEFPVVFCPFAWDFPLRGSGKDFLFFHDRSPEMRPTLDLSHEQKDEHLALSKRESLSENLRLFYVALTRAKSRCYMVWGRFRSAESSGPAYVLHQSSSGSIDEKVEETRKRFTLLDDEGVLSELREVVDGSAGGIRISRLPKEEGHIYSPVAEAQGAGLSCRKFERTVDREWGVSSFSSLVSGQPHLAEFPDHDEEGPKEETLAAQDEEPEGASVSPDILSFPRGAKAGAFFHDVLEHYDFARDTRTSVEKLVSSKLFQYGFDSMWVNTVCDTLEELVSAPLDPALNGFTLSCLQREHRLDELEFHFPVKEISSERLKAAWPEFPETLGRLELSPTKGYMKGFIDMVFHWQGRFFLVDWKSNYLGGRLEDYHHDSLYKAMRERYYFLQYLIYTLALDQYLRLRLPGYSYRTHFGGVYYVFLRGVHAETTASHGIFRDFPSPATVKALREELMEVE